MKQQNRYDIFIEKLSKEFSQIDKIGKSLFNFVIKRLTEINTFKGLFTHYYLPAAAKAVANDLRDWQTSKYKHLVEITKEELKENYYETIRLGYIGMFHKYENYVNDLILNAELLISELDDGEIPLTQFTEKVFNYKIKDWKNSPTVGRLNWIAICCKHYDGYPVKQPKHLVYTHLPDTEKLKFTKDDFVRDIDLLISQYNLMLQFVLLLAMYKMAFGGDIRRDQFQEHLSDQKLIEGKILLHNQILKVIELNNLL